MANEDELSNDARALIAAWFPYGPKASVKIGGEGCKSILSERGAAAIEELVAKGFVVAEQFNRFGRMLYTGTEKCLGVRVSFEEIEAIGGFSPTMPNPDADERAKVLPLASIQLSSGGDNAKH